MDLSFTLRRIKDWEFSPENVESSDAPVIAWIYGKLDRGKREGLVARKRTQKFQKKVRRAYRKAEATLENPNSYNAQKIEALRVKGTLHSHLSPENWQAVFPDIEQSADIAIECFEQVPEEATEELAQAYNLKMQSIKGLISVPAALYEKYGELLFKTGSLLHSVRRADDALEALVERRNYTPNDLTAEELVLTIYRERVEQTQEECQSDIAEINSINQREREKRLAPLEHRLRKIGKLPEQPQEPKAPPDFDSIRQKRLYAIEMRTYRMALEKWATDFRRYSKRTKKYGNEATLNDLIRITNEEYDIKLQVQPDTLVTAEDQLCRKALTLANQSHLVANLGNTKVYGDLTKILEGIADMYRRYEKTKQEIEIREVITGIQAIDIGKRAGNYIRLAELYQKQKGMQNMVAVCCDEAIKLAPTAGPVIASHMDKIGRTDLAKKYNPPKKKATPAH